jgi:hypothetical protein
MTALDFKFQLTEEDRRAFVLWYTSTDEAHKAARNSVVLWLLLFTTVMAVAMGSTQQGGQRVIAFAVVAFIGAAISGWYWRTYGLRAADSAMVTERTRPVPGALDVLTVHADSTGISLSSDLADSHFAWAAFTHVSDTGDALVLWRGYHPYAVIPHKSCQGVEFKEVARFLNAPIPPSNQSLERTREE